MRSRRHKPASVQPPVAVTLTMRVRYYGNMLVSLYHYVQDTSDWNKWTYRSVSLRKARELEAEGKARAETRMLDGVVQIVGYKMTEPMRLEKPSPTTLTMATSKAASGEYSGGERGSRPTLREADHIAKFTLWPLVGDTKAVAVRPRQTDKERSLALDLIGANGAQAQSAAERLIARGALAKAA